MVYGQWSEGFRLGTGQAPNNVSLCGDILAPSQIDSDTTENFEVGVKSSFADRRITVNAAVYRINWEGMPLFITPVPGCSFQVNAAESKSEGVEIEVQAILTESLQLDVSASYGEATLTEDSGAIGDKGDDLPGSADFNMSLGLEYGFALAEYPSFVRFDYNYQSEYYGNTDGSGQAAGGFGQLNLKAGMTVISV